MLIGSFTIQGAIPFPQPDAALVGFLLILGLVGWLLATYLTCLSFMPMAAVYFTEWASLGASRRGVNDGAVIGAGGSNRGARAAKDGRRLKRSASSAKSFIGARLEKSKPYRKSCWRYIKQYAVIYSPFVLSSFAWSLMAALTPSDPRPLWLNSYFVAMELFIVTLISVIAILYFMERRTGKPVLVATDNAGSRMSRWDVAFLSLVSSVIACFWAAIMFLVVVMLAIRDNLISGDASPWWLLAIVGAMIAWHAIVRAIVVLKWHLVASALAFFLLVGILFKFADQIGGLCLRPFGYGGGTPVLMVANLYDPSTKATSPTEVKGCLVLAIGSQVTIQIPGGKPKTIRCQLSPKAQVEVDDGTKSTKIHVDPVTINSSSVLQMVHLSPQ